MRKTQKEPLVRHRILVGAGGLLATLLAVGQPVASAAHASAAVTRPHRAALTAAEAKALSTDVTRRVIVEFKQQVSDLPDTVADAADRGRAIASAQSSVRRELAETSSRQIHSYRLIDAISATVSPGEEARLAANPAVSKVIPDEQIAMPDAVSAATSAATTVGKAVIPPGNACLAHGKVQLNPQADSAVDALSQVKGAKTAASLGYTGAGVKVGFIADGLDTTDPDFIRADGKHVFVDYKDFSGSGTGSPTDGGEAFLDAGSIASQGRVAYNVAHYSDLPDAEPCNIKIEGIAPGVSLVGLDIFGDQDFVYSSVLLEAIDYAVTTDHVNVLNESIGDNEFPDVATLDLTTQADNAAVAAGVTVTVSSGDAGTTGTVGSPATDPAVISAGASTTYRLDAQDGYGGARLPGVKGWLNDNISSFSSGGTDEIGHTIDVVAPGELNWLPCSPDIKMYADCTNLAGKPSAVQATGGTSEAAPVTAGVAALVIEAYEKAHGGTAPTPAVVKEIITSTATPIDAPGDQEGAGLVDAYRAVLAAKSYAQPTKAAGNTILASPSQLDFSAPPGTAETGTVTVTNSGSATQTVAASARQLGAYTTIATGRVVLSNTKSPHVIDWQGKTDNIEKVTFTVPGGKDRLNAAIAFRNASLTNLDARVRLTLIDPKGRLAAYSVPQGDGGYGDVQVASPAAGTWTAYIYSRVTNAGGTSGPVTFGASVADWAPLGTVSPSTLTLAPGASGTVTVTDATPSSPGDGIGSLLLRTSVAGKSTGTSSVPIVLRSMVPTGGTTFTGTLTGGNGREPATGQTAYYALDLPAGEPELNASITVTDRYDLFSAELVDPQGQAVAVADNETFSASTDGEVPVAELGAQLHALAPAAGTWDLVIDFAPTVSGTAISSPYTVEVDQAAVGATSAGLPDSAATSLATGTPTEASVTVHNTGTAPESYFVDPRLDTTATIALRPLTASKLTVTPGSPGVPYLVPTDTTGITWSAQSGIPLLDEDTYVYGDPDLIGSVTGTTASGSFSAQPVVAGPFLNAPEFVGPDGTKGKTTALVSTAMTATTASFDPAITSSTGDLWATATEPNNKVNLVVVDPGQSATIPLTITPTGPVGSTVTGTVYIDDAYLDAFDEAYLPQGNQAAAVPYSYTVGS
jgi:hypothetical protein